MAYLTRKQRLRLKKIRLKKTKERRGKHPILIRYLLKTFYIKAWKYKNLRMLNYNMYFKYLLEKLKNYDIYKYYFYLKIRKELIDNTNRLVTINDRGNRDLILYNLLYNKIFNYYDNNYTKQSKYLSYIHRFKKDFSINNTKINEYFNQIYPIYNILEKYIDNFNFSYSILIDFHRYLIPINYKFGRNTKNVRVRYFPNKWLDMELNYNNDVDILKNTYVKETEMFKEDYLESLEPSNYDQFAAYINYFDLHPTKLPHYSLLPHRQPLKDFYIENFFIDELNIKNYPYYYINIDELKLFLNKLKLSEKEKIFQIKLSIAHNENLKTLNIPKVYVNFVENLKKPEISNYNQENINQVRLIEKSKIFPDTTIFMIFSTKTLLNFIEIFLFKFKNILPLKKLLQDLYNSLSNFESFANFYNILINEFNLIKFKLNLYSINYVLDFLNLLYNVVKSFSTFDNILLFNMQKVKYLFSNLPIFKLNYFKRFIMFEVNNDSNWLNFLYYTYSTTNFVENLNFYSQMFSEYIYKHYTSTPEQLSVKVLETLNCYKLYIYLYFEEYIIANKLSTFANFEYRYRRFKTFSIKYSKKVHNNFFYGFFKNFFYNLIDKFKPYSFFQFNIGIFNLINTFKYKYRLMRKFLMNSFLSPRNMPFALDNIAALQLHAFTFTNQSYKLHELFTNYILNSPQKTNDFDVWDLIEKNTELSTIDEKQRMFLFLAYSNLMLHIVFENINVHRTHKVKLKGFLWKYINHIKYVLFEHEKVDLMLAQDHPESKVYRFVELDNIILELSQDVKKLK